MSIGNVEVLVIVSVTDETLRHIASMDRRIRVVDARGWFDVEIGETWPGWTVQRYLAQREIPASSREDRDRLLASAEVVLGGWPPLLDLRARAPRLRWFHQLPAGASNLLRTDLWGSDVIVTTSRGYGNTRAMAEYVSGKVQYSVPGTWRSAGSSLQLWPRSRLLKSAAGCVHGLFRRR
jgi:hypothetical protein